jgi:alanyl-tRNA synthetase
LLLSLEGKPGETERMMAQSFTSGAQAAVLAVGGNPPAVLLAASPDSAIDAGKILKEWLAEMGGRGGGSAQIAQGSLADSAAVERLLGKWRDQFGR